MRVEYGAGKSVDVVVSVGPEHKVSELAVALGCFLGCADPVELIGRTGDRVATVDAAAPVVGSGLVSGSVVRLGVVGGSTEPGPDRSADEGAVTGPSVDVVGGPDTGRSFPLGGPGRYVVGRDASAAVCLDDPSVSRRHAVLIVDGDGKAVLHPLTAATNGLVVGGVDVTGPTPVSEHDVVRLGATRIVVRDVVISDRSAQSGARSPDVEVRPGPYRPSVIPSSEVEPFGPVPDRPEQRRPPVVSIVAPLGLGLVMFAVFGHLQFLLLVLVSPVLLVASVAEDRRSARREMGRRVEQFERDLSRYCERLSEMREREFRARHLAAPDLADLARRARSRTPTLWQRRSTDSDALVVRVGVGVMSAAHGSEIARGGADDLRERAVEALTGYATVDEVPITIDLRRQGMVVVCGPVEVVDGLVGSLLIQLAALQSPDELVIAAVIGSDRPFDWIDWLPHVRLPGSGPADRLVVRSAAEASVVFERVARLADSPSSDQRRMAVVVIDGTLDIGTALSARFLDEASATGLIVVWLANDSASVPRQAKAVVTVGVADDRSRWAEIWSVDHGAHERRFEPETVRPEVADPTARALAPLRDVSGVGRSRVPPGSVTLFDVLGLPEAGIEQLTAVVAGRWSSSGLQPTDGLRVPVGWTGDGRVVLDLVADGPHALVAGTSGSGKSEFLQSLVMSLAVHHPPDRVSILFVDYKGGATSGVFDSLPHSVGTVSNLTPGLAQRVLVSLRAELERRMALLHGRAPDLAQLRRVDPESVPPSLVVVVDEFATLVTEVPEFVAGMIDVAQRGRSLGIHLILATQRPSGSVTDDILANTGLRIGLRMVDPVESTTILGTPAAAGLRGIGRALVRRGDGRLLEFQAPFAGAPLRGGGRGIGVRWLRSSRGAVDESTIAEVPPIVDTQLRCLIDVVAGAVDRLGLRAPQRPWCEPLPAVVPLDALLDRVSASDADGQSRSVPSGWPLVLGLLDEPASQRQRPAVVDVADGLLVVGGKGAGVATLVRTLVASSGHTSVGDAVVFDGRSSGLTDLEGARGVAAVVPASDLEAVTRWIVVLEDELCRRRRLLDSGDGTPQRRILLVIHGFEGVVGALLDGGAGRRTGTINTAGEPWVDRLLRLVVDGADVGIASVVTAGRRGEVPGRVESGLVTRLVLRTSDPGAWSDHGLAAGDVQDLVPGRGHVLRGDGGPVLVQVACSGPDTGSGAVAPDRSVRLISRRLPDRVELIDRTRAVPGSVSQSSVTLGVADVTGQPVQLDLGRSDFVVFGPPTSGRSTVLAVVAASIAARCVEIGAPPVRVFGSSSGPLAALIGQAGIRTVFDTPFDGVLDGVLDDGALCDVVVDDADLLAPDRAVTAMLAGTRGGRLIAAIEQRSMTGYHASPLVSRVRRARRMLSLTPDDPAEFLQVTGVRWPIRPGLPLPSGRGVLVVDRVATVLQVAPMPHLGRSVQSTG